MRCTIVDTRRSWRHEALIACVLMCWTARAPRPNDTTMTHYKPAELLLLLLRLLVVEAAGRADVTYDLPRASIVNVIPTASEETRPHSMRR